MNLQYIEWEGVDSSLDVRLRCVLLGCLWAGGEGKAGAAIRRKGRAWTACWACPQVGISCVHIPAKHVS